jgi:hypothetical protein
MTQAKGVQRFRSAEEMNASTPLVRTGDEFERFLRHCARYWTVAPRAYPRGVFKFRRIEDAEAMCTLHAIPDPSSPR